MTSGFLLGKFMPLHAGHQLLIDTARAMVDRLTILVCWLPDDPVPGELRRQWVAELYPDCAVIGHGAVVPQEPADHPDFWSIWTAIVQGAHPSAIDMVFASEPYGEELAARVGARFVPVDIDRSAIPVSATAVRAAPAAHWRWLSEPVRRHYRRRIVLHGPESVGKSALAQRLARHFGTVAMPEYGRTYCETFGTALDADDLARIFAGHVAMDAALRPHAGPLMIADTDPLMTQAWATMLLGTRLPAIDAWEDVADLYLVPALDLPWRDDGTRLFGSDSARRQFMDAALSELERRQLRWAWVEGEGDARLQSALAAIDAAGLA
ncbi:MAG: AAA family ATPase [Sphingopyxis sp.]|uniref:AAA family ATPase n=1 Tax=Sphingopyxis sp. TaxID=1908224 RepID=UPI003D8107CB